MLTFKDYLVESLNNPYPYRLTWRKPYSYVYEFTTENGRKGKVYFTDYKNEDREGESVDYESEYTSYDWEVEFKIDNSIRITGGGDPYRIFSTVIKIMEDFVHNSHEEMDSLKLSAVREFDDKESRIKLYRMMLKKFSRSHNFTVHEEEAYDQVNFTIYKQ